MKNLTAMADKTAVSLSLLCALHCLAMPVAVVLLPTLAGLAIAEEGFHLWMVFAVIPVSIYALTMGCKKHKRYQLLVIGGIGLAIVLAAALLGHDLLGEMWEKVLTVIGVNVIAVGHIWNYRLCQQHDNCGDAKQA